MTLAGGDAGVDKAVFQELVPVARSGKREKLHSHNRVFKLLAVILSFGTSERTALHGALQFLEFLTASWVPGEGSR